MSFKNLLLCLVFLVSTSVICQEKEFNFKGKVYYKGKGLKGVLVEVFQGGNLEYETSTKAGGSFSFKLNEERSYMVEISMENYRGKTIWISTKGTKKIMFKVPTFSFDVHLKEEKITPYDELSEIPVTLIKYQPKKEEFYMDKTYERALKNKKKTIKDNTLQIR